MSNVDKLFERVGSIQLHARVYFDYLSKLLANLDLDEMAAFIGELERARQSGNTIFIAGNGGSAATASHFANDIGMCSLKSGTQTLPFKILALTDNVGLITAIGNDNGYENLFVDQLKIHYRHGDILIVISASGNSPNVVKATHWVQANGGRVIALTGFDGGKLKEICDIVVHVNTPPGEYGPVEDVHMIIDHLVTTWLQDRIKEN